MKHDGGALNDMNGPWSSCFIKGLYPFISNLFTSDIKLVNISDDHFLSDYYQSYGNEVYPVIFPTYFHNELFEEVKPYYYPSTEP